jgi:type IV secretory pathway TraG/TraD family ATPase VirD4
MIDEFGSFATENFIELLNKARSAGMGITIIHQSLGDIEGVDKNFARQIYENTNIKIALRVDDPQTIDQFCKMSGTHQERKYTYHTIFGIIGNRESGNASMREVDAFNVNPNIFRRLNIGEAVVMIKTRSEFHTVKLDYFDPPPLNLGECTYQARRMVIEGKFDELPNQNHSEIPNEPLAEQVQVADSPNSTARTDDLELKSKPKRKPKKFPIQENRHEVA